MGDEVDVEKQEDALRSLINLAANVNNMGKLLHVGSVERVVALLGASDDIIVMLACWCANNFAVHALPEVFARFAACDVASAFQRVLDLSARDVLLKATWAVTNLSRDAHLAQQFVSKGLHGSLVQLMSDYADDAEMLEHAVDPLYNLLYADSALAVAVARAGAIRIAVAALRSADTHFALRAKLLRFLSMFTLSHDALRQYLVAEGVLVPLYALLQPGAEADAQADEAAEAQAVALRTLNNLAVADANEVAILASGCLIPVVELLRAPDALIVANAASVLANLSQNERVREALRHYGWLDALLLLLRAQMAATPDAADAQLLDCLARFLCNVSVDEWSRQLLLDHSATALVHAALARFAHLEAVALYLTRARDNLALPVSNDTLAAMQSRYAPKPDLRSPRAQSALSATPSSSRPYSWTPMKSEFVAGEAPSPTVGASASRVRSAFDWSAGQSAQTALKPVAFAPGLATMAPTELVSPLHAMPAAASPSLTVSVSPPPSSSSSPNLLGAHRPTGDRRGGLVAGLQRKSKENRGSMPALPSRSPVARDAVVKPASADDLSLGGSPLPAAAPAAHYSPTDDQSHVKREHISRELLSTETTYVNALQLMFEIVVEPSRRFLSSTQMADIFGGLEEIAEIHGAFLASLQARMSAWTWDTQVADLFVALAERLKSYSTFINKYPLAMASYGELIEANVRYRAALHALAQLRLPAVPVPLLAGHFFIMPVQRIPRYILLLEDLAKSTPPNHVDAKALALALDKLRAVANQINDAKAKAEEAGKVATLSSKIVGFPGQLVKPGRALVKEGAVIRRVRTKGKWKANYVYLVLLSDMLVETTQERRTLTYSSMHALSNFAEVVADPDDEVDTKRDKFLFRVRLKSGEDDLFFLCDSDLLRAVWINAMSSLLKGR